jgi:hypothetical protein
LARCAACATEAEKRQNARSLLRDALSCEEAPPAFRERTAARLYDRFAEQLRPVAPVENWQWALPLLKEEEA